MPNSPTRLKARLSEALARVESLEREKQNAKETVKSLLEDLKEKNLVCVCVCVRERERERERVCVCERERESVCVCV